MNPNAILLNRGVVPQRLPHREARRPTSSPTTRSPMNPRPHPHPGSAVLTKDASSTCYRSREPVKLDLPNNIHKPNSRVLPIPSSDTGGDRTVSKLPKLKSALPSSSASTDFDGRLTLDLDYVPPTLPIRSGRGHLPVSREVFCTGGERITAGVLFSDISWPATLQVRTLVWAFCPASEGILSHARGPKCGLPSTFAGTHTLAIVEQFLH